MGMNPAKIVIAVCALIATASPHGALAQTPAPGERVLVVVNDRSPLSRNIGEYYARRRGVPLKNICHIQTPPLEDIARKEYDRGIAAPVAGCLQKQGLVETVYYIVTTAGVPLRIPAVEKNDQAAVDSELTLLYGELKGGARHRLPGTIPNPFYGKREIAFSHPQFPIYLVTRLAAYDFAGVKAMIDRSLAAANTGKFVIDMSSGGSGEGEDWLRNAAVFLPKDRVIFDETSKPVYDQTGVIGYASWGSNDANHRRRFPGFKWLPGAIVTEFVSTDGRTFVRPPDNWTPSKNWRDASGFFAHSPQSMSADYLLEGATGVSGHVDEPYLVMAPRPDLLLPAYFNGRNLAESYYLSMRSLSWQNIVLGDPLCSLGKPPGR